GDKADHKLAKEWEREYISKVISTNIDNTHSESTIRVNNGLLNQNDQNKVLT
ncbi:2295_t:CDS:1, partial [Racocetra fulgida]